MFNVFKKLGSSGNANYEAAKASVHKDLENQRLLAMQRTEDYMTKLENKLTIATTTLNALGNMQTSGGGPDSLMAYYAREAMNKIKELDK
jgi:hypothetical protein